VIPKWRELIVQGKPVQVTDPECTRFWMFMDEAIDLVLNTIQTMEGGELVIPKLPAYRVGDLAEAMGAQVHVIGLKNHEKMHEGMEEGNTSDRARRMNIEELKEKLARV
jgi:UDP-N-acetylglucosamine 4,6-dehydratase